MQLSVASIPSVKASSNAHPLASPVSFTVLWIVVAVDLMIDELLLIFLYVFVSY
jgi:hypothetical protein